MRWLLLLSVLCCITPSLAAAQEKAADIVIQQDKDVVQILQGGNRIATYLAKDAKIPRPFFKDLQAQGRRLTRNHPPMAGDAGDHATFHPGLWLTFGDLSGADYWRGQAKVELKDLAIAKPGVGSQRFTARLDYLTRAGTVQATETSRFTFHSRPEGWLLVWEAEFKALDQDLEFGDQEEMGLGVRLHTPLTVQAGGTIRNSLGKVNEKDVWGKTADWCEYSGVVDGKRQGVVLMAGPDNFRPSWWHARDYGLLVANPFGKSAFTGGEKSKIVVKAKQSLRLTFGVLAFAREDEKSPAVSGYLDFLKILGAKREGP